MTEIPEWRSFSSTVVRKASCRDCGIESPWDAQGWKFRYRGLRGTPRKGTPKVMTERLCPACFDKLNNPGAPLT